jgi:hypothetical protein
VIKYKMVQTSNFVRQVYAGRIELVALSKWLYNRARLELFKLSIAYGGSKPRIDHRCSYHVFDPCFSFAMLFMSEVP